jgi:hypothetical protein
MFATTRLLQAFGTRITMFSRNNCGLCSNAKEVLSEVWDKRHFDFKEVDLAQPEHKSWKDLYDFDIPVVSFQTVVLRPLTSILTTDDRFTSVKQGPTRKK